MSLNGVNDTLAVLANAAADAEAKLKKGRRKKKKSRRGMWFTK